MLNAIWAVVSQYIFYFQITLHIFQKLNADCCLVFVNILSNILSCFKSNTIHLPNLFKLHNGNSSYSVIVGSFSESGYQWKQCSVCHRCERKRFSTWSIKSSHIKVKIILLVQKQIFIVTWKSQNLLFNCNISLWTDVMVTFSKCVRRREA